MPTTALSSKFRLGFAKQTAEGTATATAAFEPSLIEGQIMPANNEQPISTADSADLTPGSYILGASWSGAPVINTDHDMIGLPLLLHFGSGSDAVVGSSNYTHTFTRQTAPLYSTFHFMRPAILGGTDQWDRGVDGLVRAIELRCPAPGDALRLAMDVVGKTYTTNRTAPTVTATKKWTSAAGFLTFQGATMLLDTDATPAVTQVHNIADFVLRSEYANAAWVQTDVLTPTYLSRGEYGLGFTCTAILEDYGYFYQTFFGAKAPGASAALSSIVVTGSIDFTFSLGGQAASATKQLQVKVPNMRFRVDAPAPDAGGSELRYSVTGVMYASTVGSESTWILANQTPSY